MKGYKPCFFNLTGNVTLLSKSICQRTESEHIYFVFSLAPCNVSHVSPTLSDCVLSTRCKLQEEMNFDFNQLLKITTILLTGDEKANWFNSSSTSVTHG